MAGFLVSETGWLKKVFFGAVVTAAAETQVNGILDIARLINRILDCTRKYGEKKNIFQ